MAARDKCLRGGSQEDSWGTGAEFVQKVRDSAEIQMLPRGQQSQFSPEQILPSTK